MIVSLTFPEIKNFVRDQYTPFGQKIQSFPAQKSRDPPKKFAARYPRKGQKTVCNFPKKAAGCGKPVENTAFHPRNRRKTGEVFTFSTGFSTAESGEKAGSAFTDSIIAFACGLPQQPENGRETGRKIQSKIGENVREMTGNPRPVLL